jgi:uncharacterized protein (DUF1501 family)
MIKRRHVLRGLGGIAIAPTFFQSLAATEAAIPGKILVCILLNGGNDGLNTVVPLKQYGNYVKLRTPAPPPAGLNMAYAEGDLQNLAFDPKISTLPGQATNFAFAPGMDAMRLLYAGGHLAVVTGVGLPKQEQNALSHPNGQIDWLTGQINVGETVPPGWLGLTLDRAAAGSLGPSASFGGSVPLVVGAKKQGLVINPPMDYFNVSYGTSDSQAKLIYAYRQIGVMPAAAASASYDQKQMEAALADITTIQSYAKREPASTYATPTYLDYQLRDIARLIVAGAGMRGFFAQTGGFDTHSTQALTQPLLLQQLSESLAQFYYYLQEKGVSKDVVIMTMSDFGRRPAANLDFGTDHGGSSVSFVLGDPVKGGVYGNYPSLTKFDQNGNLALEVDFRNVLSDLMVSMGGDPKAVLGEQWPSLGFIA